MEGGRESRSLWVKISIGRVLKVCFCNALVLIQLKITVSTRNNCSSGFGTSLMWLLHSWGQMVIPGQWQNVRNASFSGNLQKSHCPLANGGIAENLLSFISFVHNTTESLLRFNEVKCLLCLLFSSSIVIWLIRPHYFIGNNHRAHLFLMGDFLRKAFKLLQGSVHIAFLRQWRTF